MRRILAAKRHDRGQAMVEFAIVIPLLLMIMIAVFEFARAWNVYHIMTDAARAGARSAVVADPNVTQDSVVNIVRGALARGAVNPDIATITLNGFRTGTGTPAQVTIQLPYQFVFIRPFLGWSASDASLTLTTNFVMRNE